MGAMSLESDNSFAEQQYVIDMAYDDNQNSSQINSYRKNFPMVYSNVTWLDRWLVRKMLAVVADPPVRISLWDGVEVTPHCEHPVAVMVYCDRGALF